MRNIPDIDATAYGGESLQRMDLLALSDAYEVTQDLLAQVETAAREVRERIEPIQPRDRTPDQVAEHGAAARRVALIRRIAKEVRTRFAQRVRATCEWKGFLGRSTVFVASPDATGVQRIPLHNPPSPPAKPTVLPQPEGGFR